VLGALLGWSVVGGMGGVLCECEIEDAFCCGGGSCLLGCRLLECIGVEAEGCLMGGGLEKVVRGGIHMLS